MTDSNKRLFKALLLISAMVSALWSAATMAQTRVMPLGDSITGSPGCWRALLWNQLQDAGHTDIDFVGTLPEQGCGVEHDGDNEGHGGYLATNIAYDNLLPDWLDQTNPDVVMMHLGTNDVWSNRSTTEILDAFTTLVEQMRAHNPEVTLLVAQIIPMDPSESCNECNQRVQALNNEIPDWASELSTGQSPILVVDQYTGFDYQNDTYDGVHPNASGNQKIADGWFSPLSDVLGGSAASSSVSSRSSSSSSDAPIGEGARCNWYDVYYPVCDNQVDGWGWENNESCIGYNTCEGQPEPYGVEGGADSSSAGSSSSASSLPTSTSSSSQSSAESSSETSGALQCDWYGTRYALCETQDSGWGWENNATCIGAITCEGQYGDGGIVGGDASSSDSSFSSSESSSSLSSSSSVSSSTSSTTSSSSSSVDNGVIPNAASNGWPYCRSADSDPDGDGWGWENSYSCIVYGSSADPGAGDFPYCLIGAEEITLCSSDTGSWSGEDGEICLSTRMCPGMGSVTQDPMPDEPVNPNANATTQAVYDYLQSQWGEKMLSGQMDLTWQDAIDQYQRVINDTGYAPAIMGYDFMNYGLYWNGISGLNQTEEAIAHWDRGGLVTFTWHWRDPDAPEGEIGEFYSEDTDFTIPMANGELDTSSESFANIEADVDRIAAELQTLEEAGVTVLWRPLHEASGGWFWWGRNDRTDGVPPAYAQVVLWQYLYERLTHHHGLNNLLWVWNGQSAAWYPGDDYVDIVSHDIYDGAQNYESQVETYGLTANYPHERKMVALSENSNIPDPDQMVEDGAWWLYFMVWNDIDTAEGVTNESNFWTGEYYNTQAHKEHVYSHERVITLDELPAF